ncbi:MAG: DNA-binding domain-containing protein [Polyangiaceae bacterium]
MASTAGASPGGASPQELEALQGFLAGTFQRGEPVVGDAGLQGEVARVVSGNDRLTPAEQVDIYRRQFWLRHIDSLREDHPGLGWLLGEDGFEAMCTRYLVAHPPRTPSLRELGADLARFLAADPALPEALREIAVEMARYELCMVEVFDAAEVAPVAPEKLAALPEDAWESARVVIHPALQRMHLRWPVHRLRYQVRDGDKPAVPRAAEPCHLALFRQELTIRYEELDALAFQLLEALAGGEALVPAMSRLAAAHPERAADIESSVGRWFQSWAAWGWIVDVEPHPA